LYDFLDFSLTCSQNISVLRLDGQPVDVEVSGVGINYRGRPAIQIMMRDITGRKRKVEQDIGGKINASQNTGCRADNLPNASLILEASKIAVMIWIGEFCEWESNRGPVMAIEKGSTWSLQPGLRDLDLFRIAVLGHRQGFF
jgi:hypothetical protein